MKHRVSISETEGKPCALHNLIKRAALPASSALMASSKRCGLRAAGCWLLAIKPMGWPLVWA